MRSCARVRSRPRAGCVLRGATRASGFPWRARPARPPAARAVRAAGGGGARSVGAGRKAEVDVATRESFGSLVLPFSFIFLSLNVFSFSSFRIISNSVGRREGALDSGPRLELFRARDLERERDRDLVSESARYSSRQWRESASSISTKNGDAFGGSLQSSAAAQPQLV